MPIQAPQWMDYLNCPVCCREFGAPPRSPVSLGCGHTLCSHCLKHLNRRQCPFDQSSIQVDSEELVVNTALLQLAGYAPPEQPYHPPSIQALPESDRQSYDHIVRCMEHLAAYLKYCGSAGGRLSRPMQRKLVTLLQCAVSEAEGRGRAARAARSLGERTVTELILQHQNPQQLSANLWAAVRARGCQFLGPAMQEEVLKLVLLALEDGSALSRKVLVMFVVQRLEPHFPQASKTSIGHVVQLLYRASCFKVSKRECDSSLMQLKEEFRTYESLRREHDAQIVQIATEAGLRIAPDQWSALLYGDTAHKSHMQSIIDKLQTPQSFAQSVQELFIALQRTGDPAQLVLMSLHLDRLANIDAAQDANCPSWQQLAEVMTSLKEVVAGLIYYLQLQALGRDSNHNQKHNQPDRCLDNSASQAPAPAPAAAATQLPAAGREPGADREPDRCEEFVSRVNGNFALIPVHGSQARLPAPPYASSYVPPHAPPHGMCAFDYPAPLAPREPAAAASDAPRAADGRAMGYALPPGAVVVGAGARAEPVYYRLFRGAPDDAGAFVPARPLYLPAAAVFDARHALYDPAVPPYEYYASQPPPPPPPRYGPELRAEPAWSDAAEVYGYGDRLLAAAPAPAPVTMYAFDDMMGALPAASSTEVSGHSAALPFASRRSSPVDAAGPKAVGGPISRCGAATASEGSSPDPASAARAQGPAAAERPADAEGVAVEPLANYESNLLAPSYEDTGLDYEQLEAGLQALERRIDTEFKSAD